MTATLNVVHWLAAFIVMAEALNKMERIAPFAPDLSIRKRLLTGIRSMGWLLTASGAGGALVGPLIQPLGLRVLNSQILAHVNPSFAEVCVMTGFAVLIIKTRVEEGLP